MQSPEDIVYAEIGHDDAEKRQQMGMKAKEDFFDHMDYEHFYVQIKKLYGSYL